MVFENGSQIEDFATCDLDYLRGRVREEANAAVSAETLASTLIHVVLATAYAKRCGGSDDRIVDSGRAWVEKVRIR